MNRKLILPSILALILFVGIAPTEGSAGLVDGLWFSSEPITNYHEVTVYSVVRNQTDTALEGIATLVVDGEAVDAQEVRVKARGIERIGIAHLFSAGTHSVGLSFTAGSGFDVDLTELPKRTVFVVEDSDGDGIQDTTDPDDDNDGIPDEEDTQPFVKQIVPSSEKSLSDLSESGQAFLAKITNRFVSASTTKEAESAVVASTTNEDSGEEPGALMAVVRNVEDARKRGAEAMREYEAQQREALEVIEHEEEALAAVEGFEPSVSHESKKREHQIAAASASIFGTMLEKGWLFYSELIVLTLGISHLVIVWFRERFNAVEEEE